MSATTRQRQNRERRGGLCYGASSVSHHATEDLALCAPPWFDGGGAGRPVETRAATRAVAAYRAVLPSPGEGRGTGGAPDQIDFSLAGDPLLRWAGPDPDLHRRFAADGRAHRGVAKRARDRHARSEHAHLEASGRGCDPAGGAETSLIATLEEHSILGGLGTAVAEVLAERPGLEFRSSGLGCPLSSRPYRQPEICCASTV